MTNPTYAVSVDTPRTPLLSDDTDVTSDIIAAGRGSGGVGLHIERGHDLTRVLSPPMAGAAAFTLDNIAGAYGLASDLKAGAGMRALATYGGVTYPMFRGVLDHPVQSQPDSHLPDVRVQCFGNLARLAGRTVSTALYAAITTGQAMNYLLDAASFPKNLPGYLDGLGPLVGYNLDAASGVDPDTATGHDATLTLGAGVRADTAIEDGGTLTTEFDGLATLYTVTAHADFNNWTNADSMFFCLFKADTDGEGHAGRIYSKGLNYLYVGDQSGSTMRLLFLQDFGVLAGLWQTTSRVITVGVRYALAMHYNGSSSANDPTIWLLDLDHYTYTKLTVGSGLTEVQTPSGAHTTDAAQNLILGNNLAASATFDGNIGCVRVYGPLGNAAYFEPLAQQALELAANAPRQIDDGHTTLDYWWLDNADALTSLEVLKNSEGPGAALYEARNGAVTFKDRHARATDSRSTAVQTTFSVSAEPQPSSPFNYDPGLRDVVNVCEATTEVRELAALGEVWSLGSDVVIGAGETKRFIARQTNGNPFTAAVAPTSGGGDYTVSTGSISAPTLDRTSGAQVTISIYSAAGATITGLRLRAQSVDVASTSVVANTLDTSASQELYGVATFRLNVRPEIGVNNAQDFCNAVVAFYQDGRPTVSFALETGFDDTRMVAALAREVGDRVHLTASADIDSDMFVERVSHDVYTSGVLITTLGLSEAGAVPSLFRLDTSRLDSTDTITF